MRVDVRLRSCFAHFVRRVSCRLECTIGSQTGRTPTTGGSPACPSQILSIVLLLISLEENEDPS